MSLLVKRSLLMLFASSSPTQVVFPAGWTEEQITAADAVRAPEKPAKKYPFPLDAFQATSCDCLASPSLLRLPFPPVQRRRNLRGASAPLTPTAAQSLHFAGA